MFDRYNQNGTSFYVEDPFYVVFFSKEGFLS